MRGQGLELHAAIAGTMIRWLNLGVARRLISEWDSVGGWLVALAVAISIAALALALADA